MISHGRSTHRSRPPPGINVLITGLETEPKPMEHEFIELRNIATMPNLSSRTERQSSST